MPLPSGTHFPIQVISTIKPVNGAGFPVVSDVDIEGGYQVHATLTDRNNIPLNNRKEGMLVYVQADGYFYTLSGGITNSDWIVKDFGSSTPNVSNATYDLTGTSNETTLGRINNFPIGIVNNPNGYIASVPEHENLHIFKNAGKVCTDGAHIWSANSDAIEEDKANFNKTVLVDYGASYGLDYSSALFGAVTGTSCTVNPSFSPYLFAASLAEDKLLVIEKATDRVVGLGDDGAQVFTNLAIDSDGNIWGTSVTHGEKISKFNTQEVIDAYPSTQIPEISISILSGSSDLFYDGTSMWVAGGSFIERILSPDVIYLDSYDASTDFPGLVYRGICVVNDFVFATASDQIHRFNISSFQSGPDLVIPVTSGEFGKIIFSNNFLWVTNQGTGELHQFNVTLDELNVFSTPVGTINFSVSICKHPTLNEIYISVSGSDAVSNGILTFNTETLTYNTKRFYTQSQPSQIKSIPAACLTADRPENPFIGQTVFVTDLGTPRPVWWNGADWVDAAGDIA